MHKGRIDFDLIRSRQLNDCLNHASLTRSALRYLSCLHIYRGLHGNAIAAVPIASFVNPFFADYVFLFVSYRCLLFGCRLEATYMQHLLALFIIENMTGSGAAAV